MQIYAVVYVDDGRFLVFKKRDKGYFFFKNGEGSLVRGGQRLNGAGDWALPGGAREGRESIGDGAEREFHEETAIHLPAATSEHEFSDQYGAGYFQVDGTTFGNLLRDIGSTNLPAGNSAATEVGNGTITRYDQIHQRYSASPLDNELASVEAWNVTNGGNWGTIQSWERNRALNWYYAILKYLKEDILGV